MAFIKFELPARNEAERNAKRLLEDLVPVLNDNGDCRTLRNVIRTTMEQAGVPVEIGGGGSHLWIHRADDHVEGNPYASGRWAIITDEPLTQ